MTNTTHITNADLATLQGAEAINETKQMLISVPASGLGPGQWIRVQFYLGDFQVSVVEFKGGKYVAVGGPGFKIPPRPDVRIDFSNNMNVTMRPAAIGWVGFGGGDTQARPGAIALAAQVAEEIAAIVSNPAGHRAIERLATVEAEVRSIRADQEAHKAHTARVEALAEKRLAAIEAHATKAGKPVTGLRLSGVPGHTSTLKIANLELNGVFTGEAKGRIRTVGEANGVEFRLGGGRYERVTI